MQQSLDYYGTGIAIIIPLLEITKQAQWDKVICPKLQSR